jgi:nitrate reductase molybdenum cofactor assembly chaperone NarJ/NarW
MDRLKDVRALGAVGAALAYPHQGLRDAMRHAVKTLGAPDAEASQSILQFLSATAGLTDAALAETYTRTFDLAPHCAPYVGVHLFGEQDARRSQLMVGLAEEYAEAGVEAGGELPDHVALVLQALEKMPPARARELAELCVKPALASMARQLAVGDNPYVHLVTAASLLMRDAPAAMPAEVSHA